MSGPAYRHEDPPRNDRRTLEIFMEGGRMKKHYPNYMGVGYHTMIASRALGRRLKRPECVHHIDENKANNSPDNLVVCPDVAYHSLLHIRQQAYNATGDYSQRKCRVCGNYDKTENMKEYKRGKSNYFVHKLCRNKKANDWYHGQ
jgi:hypothetical protein